MSGAGAIYSEERLVIYNFAGLTLVTYNVDANPMLNTVQSALSALSQQDRSCMALAETVRRLCRWTGWERRPSRFVVLATRRSQTLRNHLKLCTGGTSTPVCDQALVANPAQPDRLTAEHA